MIFNLFVIHRSVKKGWYCYTMYGKIREVRHWIDEKLADEIQSFQFPYLDFLFEL